jgi:archaemetzincin
MNLVRLLPVGKVEPSLLEGLRAAIPQRFNAGCDILSVELEPASFYHPERQQYHSSEILARMRAMARPQDCHLLGITGVDLYIPILQYVFGEAQLGGPCAIVSFHRLRQEFYGLERDDSLLSGRLLKECIHDLGHTLDLRHCQDYRCAMASAHAVEWIDLRENELCESCRAQVQSRRSTGKLRAIYKGLIP